MKVFKGIAAVFMVLKIVESVNDIQSGLRYSNFMNKVDHTEFELDDQGRRRYTIYMKDGRIIQQDHDVYESDFDLF